MLALGPKWQERVEQWLRAARPTSEVAARFNALPLYEDIGGVLALCSDGTMMQVAPDADTAQPVTDERWITVALVAGAERYPDLRELLPQRPPNAQPCAVCRGTGRVHGAWCGACSALGWR